MSEFNQIFEKIDEDIINHPDSVIVNEKLSIPRNKLNQIDINRLATNKRDTNKRSKYDKNLEKRTINKIMDQEAKKNKKMSNISPLQLTQMNTNSQINDIMKPIHEEYYYALCNVESYLFNLFSMNKKINSEKLYERYLERKKELDRCIYETIPQSIYDYLSRGNSLISPIKILKILKDIHSSDEIFRFTYGLDEINKSKKIGKEDQSDLMTDLINNINASPDNSKNDPISSMIDKVLYKNENKIEEDNQSDDNII